MGKGNSKLSLNFNGAPKDFNPEFEYRVKNLRKMKDAYKTLRNNLVTAMTNLEKTPQRLKEVGTGYTAVTACLNYSGGGGSASRRGTDATAEAMNNASGVMYMDSVVKPTANGCAASPPARMDRDLADEAFQASKKFCTAMETLSTSVYPKYRNILQTKVLTELDNMITLNERVMAQSKKTSDAMSKYANARNNVSAREKASAKKGKNLAVDPTYTKLVADRDAKDRAYNIELDAFDDQYENMMAEGQRFAEASTEVFLDSVVGYFHDIVETIDYTDMSSHSRTRGCSLGNNNGELRPEDWHEPTYNGSSTSPDAPVKTI